MGGGGFAADGVNSMRNNRLLRKKRKFKDIKDLVIEDSGKTELEFKQISSEELAVLKTNIRKRAKKEAEKEITIFGVCFLIVVILLVYAFVG